MGLQPPRSALVTSLWCEGNYLTVKTHRSATVSQQMSSLSSAQCLSHSRTINPRHPSTSCNLSRWHLAWPLSSALISLRWSALARAPPPTHLHSTSPVSPSTRHHPALPTSMGIRAPISSRDIAKNIHGGREETADPQSMTEGMSRTGGGRWPRRTHVCVPRSVSISNVSTNSANESGAKWTWPQGEHNRGGREGNGRTKTEAKMKGTGGVHAMVHCEMSP